MGHRRIHVPESEVTWHFSRSSGPGGQHVNTTDTRVEVRWDVGAKDILSESQREMVRSALHHRLVGDELRIVASTYRSQHRNREAAMARLDDLVASALVPRKKRKPTRPSRGATKRRLDDKKKRGQLKASRRSLGD